LEGIILLFIDWRQMGSWSAYGEWNTVFPSAACVSAMIDRLTHHATILSFAGESYRLKESSEHQAKKPNKIKKDSKT